MILYYSNKKQIDDLGFDFIREIERFEVGISLKALRENDDGGSQNDYSHESEGLLERLYNKLHSSNFGVENPLREEQKQKLLKCKNVELYKEFEEKSQSRKFSYIDDVCMYGFDLYCLLTDHE